MKAPYRIELLNPNGEVKARHQFNDLPITIGRGYDNHLIIDDRYIAARHAVVEQAEHGDLLIRDMGSLNGIIHQGKRHSQLSLSGDTTVRIGHTNLRVRGADFPVRAELADTSRYGWEGWPPALVGTAVIVVLSLLSIWITDTEKFSAIRYLMATALVLGIVMIWCGFWSFANRVFGNHARFGRHVFIVACGLLAMDVWDVATISTAYAFSWEWLTKYNEHIVMLISAVIVYFHLLTISPQHPRRFAILCTVLSLLGSGFILMNNYQRYGRLADDLYMTYILPPQIRISHNQPVAQFIDDSYKLKHELDQERLRPIKNNMTLMDDEADAASSD